MPRKSSSGRKRKSNTSSRSRSSSVRRGGGRRRSSSRTTSSGLSARTRKAIDTLPSHAQEIYKKAHKNALKQYDSPSKRRGGKRQSKEQVAHKVAWSAVKREYKKEGDRWVEKE